MDGKIWYWEDRDRLTGLREVELDTKNNISLSRIHVGIDFSLHIKEFYLFDAGIYRCINNRSQENAFNYRLERN